MRRCWDVVGGTAALIPWSPVPGGGRLTRGGGRGICNTVPYSGLVPHAGLFPRWSDAPLDCRSLDATSVILIRWQSECGFGRSMMTSGNGCCASCAEAPDPW